MRGNIIEWSHWKHLVDVLRHFDMRGNIMGVGSLETLGRYFVPFDMRGNIIEWSHWKHLVGILRHFDMRCNER